MQGHTRDVLVQNIREWFPEHRLQLLASVMAAVSVGLELGDRHGRLERFTYLTIAPMASKW